jgi:hydrogenase maturation protease
MSESAGPRVLVAGIGNVFFGDDGFGVEVAQRLAKCPLPPGVRVLDAGIRTLHLAYELAGGRYELAIFVDAVSRGQAAGTLYVIEPDANSGDVLGDAHGMRIDQLLSMARALEGGEQVERVLIVGCEPACVSEGMGLSAPVSAVVDAAARRVLELANESVFPCPS